MSAIEDAGYVVVPGVLTPKQITAILAEVDVRIDAQRREPSYRERGTLHVDDVSDIAEAAQAVAHPLLVAHVRSFLGGEPVAGRAHFRCPLPGDGAQTIHRDTSYAVTAGPFDGVTVIVALTDFRSDNGSTRVVPGSHRRYESPRARHPDDVTPGEIVVECAAGSAIVFPTTLWHSGTRNRSDAPRPSLQVLYSRSRNTSSPASVIPS